MVAVSDVAQIASRLREAGLLELAEDLADAHAGVFSSTELAMKWRFLLARALDCELPHDVREQAQSLWRQVNEALA
jgi:hypothetical protein